MVIKERKDKKLLHYSQEKLKLAEEEILESKLEIQKLNKIINNFSDQPGNGDVEYVKLVKNKSTIGTSEKHDYNGDQYMKALAEENEALRKGLHEILETLNKKKGTYLNNYMLQFIRVKKNKIPHF